MCNNKCVKELRYDFMDATLVGYPWWYSCLLAIHTERSARKKRELVIHHQSIARVDETNDQKRIRRQSHHMLKKGIA